MFDNIEEHLIKYLKMRFKLTCIGQQTKFPTFKKLFCVYFLSLIAAILLTLIVIKLTKSRNIHELAEAFESFLLFTHFFMRKLVVLKNRELFEDFLEAQFQQFWRYDRFGKQFGDEIKQEMIAYTKFIYLFAALSAVYLAALTISPVFAVNLLVPHSCWIWKDNQYIRTAVYVSEVILYIKGWFVAIFTESFFFCACYMLRTQFQLINYRIASFKFGEKAEIGEERGLKLLYECCTHHKFLLVQCKKLNKIYSEFFLMQYVLNVSTFCIIFLVIKDTSSSRTEILRSILLFSCVFCQGAVTLIPFDNLAEDAAKLPDEIFAIDWYNSNSRKVKNFIILFLMRARQPLRFAAANLFFINKNSLIQFPRQGFSISAILMKSRSK